MNLYAIKQGAISIIAAAGSAIAMALGGWDTALQTLLLFLGIDYLTGIIIALVFRKSGKSGNGSFRSGVSVKGLLQKFGVLLLVLLAYHLDGLIGTVDFARNTVILFFCANEGLSIIENLGIMGVPIPAFIKNSFEMLKKKKDKAGEQETEEELPLPIEENPTEDEK